MGPPWSAVGSLSTQMVSSWCHAEHRGCYPEVPSAKTQCVGTDRVSGRVNSGCGGQGARRSKGGAVGFGPSWGAGPRGRDEGVRSGTCWGLGGGTQTEVHSGALCAQPAQQLPAVWLAPKLVLTVLHFYGN